MTTTTTQSSLNSKIYAVCDIMRRSNCASALQYIPELTWILFLRILDEQEASEQESASAVGSTFTPSLEPPFRWRDWAAPGGDQRTELQNGFSGAVFDFVYTELLPYLQGLRQSSAATLRQKIIAEIMGAVTERRIDTEKNFLDILDAVHGISQETTDNQHVFLLSQAYEGLLLRMGEKNNDGGQFFTPREVIRAMVQVVAPQYGETVYDPACGTGGFLAQTNNYIREKLGGAATADQMELLSARTFYGREKENLIHPIVLANLILHGIDHPNIWHGNTLTRNESYGGLFDAAPDLFDVILTNPPFGGREGADAQTRYTYKTSSTQVLFLQEVINSLKPNGRAGMVVDEGLLFRTNENAFVQTKRKLLDECDLHCIVSLPGGVFTQAGSGVKTNLLFFNKGHATPNVWYYDLSEVKVTKRRPLTLSHFDEFFQLLPARADSERSWSVPIAEIRARNYDLKAVNPHRAAPADTRTPEDLIAVIEQKGQELNAALADLKSLLGPE